MFDHFRKNNEADTGGFVLSSAKQLKAWKKANRRMKWGITDKEFAAVGPPPLLSAKDRVDGFIGAILSYGFGNDGHGNADAVLSGRPAWEYAQRQRRRNIWQCRYIDFGKADHFRPRPTAPPRLRGFYYANFVRATTSFPRPLPTSSNP